MGPLTDIELIYVDNMRGRTARVKVATKAQMKLCHIVLAEKVWFISLAVS